MAKARPRIDYIPPLFCRLAGLIDWRVGSLEPRLQSYVPRISLRKARPKGLEPNPWFQRGTRVNSRCAAWKPRPTSQEKTAAGCDDDGECRRLGDGSGQRPSHRVRPV